MGEFLDYENWDEPGTVLNIKLTYMQWQMVRYLSYMVFYDESNNAEISVDEAVDKFIKKLIENEMYDPKLQGPKIEQQSLFDKND